MPKQTIGATLVAAAILTLSTTAQAASKIDFTLFSPEQQAQMARVVAKQRARQGAEYNYDIRPAVLKSISVGKSVKANLKHAEAIVTLQLADNMTGVERVSLTVQSPSGNQTAWTMWDATYPQTREELQLTVDMSNSSENGVWRVVSVDVSDANNNTTHYDEAALTAKGRTTFTVTGATGDFENPYALAGGVNLTPVVSKSTPPRGMLPGNAPRLGVQLKLADLGGSGVRSASMTFCAEDGWDCIGISGSIQVRAQSVLTLVLGGEAPEWIDLGSYRLNSLSVQDFAGNYRYFHRDYGDDLDVLLDNPVIVVAE